MVSAAARRLTLSGILQIRLSLEDGLRLWSNNVGPVFRLDISFGEEVKLSKEFAADKTGLALLINGVEQEFPYWSNQLQSFAAEMQLYVQYKPNASYSVSFNPSEIIERQSWQRILADL